MLLIYNISLQLYYFAVSIASLFNEKAKLWVSGRRNVNYIKYKKSIWFHFASLGEFEQGRPVLEHYREKYPDLKIVVTFFSPSGFEIRKNTPLADAVYYLPLDTAANARKFVEAINPAIVIFTKYEYWYHFFNELHKRNVPLYMISGIFRPGQIFFKWYGSLHRKMLNFVTWFFVQDDRSKQLLEDIGISKVTVSGDTRFDRVWTNMQTPKPLKLISEFKSGHKVFIAGSTWSKDEEFLAKLPQEYPDWKFIVAPHEISEEKINNLIQLFPEGTCIRYSQLTTHNLPFDRQDSQQTLIIDNIGMLSSLYQYGNIAYIGGGFGAGIHNTLEAAAFGLPVIFGPNYSKFKEAKDLIALQAGFIINDEIGLKKTFDFLTQDDTLYHATRQKIKRYVEENTGATKTITDHIELKHDLP